jgi:hypothetical protein
MFGGWGGGLRGEGDGGKGITLSTNRICNKADLYRNHMIMICHGHLIIHQKLVHKNLVESQHHENYFVVFFFCNVKPVDTHTTDRYLISHHQSTV